MPLPLQLSRKLCLSQLAVVIAYVREELSEVILLQELAGRRPLWQLEQMLPHSWCTDGLLSSFYTHAVPLVRAAWFLRFMLNVQASPLRSGI